MRRLLFIIGIAIYCISLGAQEETVIVDTVTLSGDDVAKLRQEGITVRDEVESDMPVFEQATVENTRNVTTMRPTTVQGVSPELQAYFLSLLPDRDTTYTAIEREGHKDTFLKRFSLHTNLLGWALLLPNLAVEVDFKQTPRNHYSIMLHGMLNGKNTNTFGTSFIFNARSIRVEGRKYWRTGKRGKAGYHTEYVKLRSRRDSDEFNGDPYRGWFYNTYYRVRRNVFSGRTVSKARDWRAYYLGVFAGVDDWNIAFGGKGRQGEGVFAGISAGWSVPIFPQQFPKEGSLDLELGINVGVKAVRYDAYTREDDTGHYVYDAANSQTGWKICPYPVVQDIHVSLVWRMRGIKNKVDASLIDDYEKKINKFIALRDKHKHASDSVQGVREQKSLVAPLETEMQKAVAMLSVISKADTSGKATPMLRLAIEQAKRDSTDMVNSLYTGIDARERARLDQEREIIAVELKYYTDKAMSMVDQSLLPVDGKKAKKKAVAVPEEEAVRAEQEAKTKAKADKKSKKKKGAEEQVTATDSTVTVEPMTVEESTATEEPVSAEEPTTAEQPVTEEEPTAEEQPTAEEPATEEQPVTEEEPTAEEEPTTEEQPATEEQPVAEEEPTTEEEQPTTEEQPAPDEQPATEEEPTTEGEE
mgnify:CR=1 FL=1